MKINVFTQLELDRLKHIERTLKGDMHDLLDGIGVYMVESVIRNFEDQGRPKKWDENSKETLKRKKGSLILHQSGLLKAGIMHQVDGRSVVVGPSGPAVPYARIHQKGGKAGRKSARVTIPPRPYLVMQEADRAYIRREIRREVMGNG